MNVDITKLFSWLGKPTKLYWAAAIVSAALLFSPLSLRDALGLTSLVTQWKQWLGLALVVSSTLLVISAFDVAQSWIRKQYTAKRDMDKKHAAMERTLARLTGAEQVVLGSYIKNQTKTRYLPRNDGVVCGLEDAGFIRQASQVPSSTYGSPEYAFNIDEWAWDYLNKHPELVPIPDNK